MRLLVWTGALLVSGCSFHLDALSVDGPALFDLPQPTVDLAVEDRPLTQADLATRDLATPPPPDMAMVPFVPSHVKAGDYQPNAANLQSVTAIDTKNLQIALNGGALMAPPAGVALVLDGTNAVLSVGKWTVDKALQITGDAPLVVIAAGAVDIKNHISVAADHSIPGPGGSASTSGTGKGTDGIHASNGDDPGGGGAGFGTDGANGGMGGVTAGAKGGKAYGAALSSFAGGSGGGAGAGASGCTNPTATGGAGGGAIQISSAVSILVEGAGLIEAGGGGGAGGCKLVGSGAGGGGSGGEIFLEAPMIDIKGTLAANGGGGGGAGLQASNADGMNGDNGQVSTNPANGGKAASTSGVGGKGGAVNSMPVNGGDGINGGGGGGAVGRIWLRTRGTLAGLGGSTVSPAAMTDLTL